MHYVLTGPRSTTAQMLDLAELSGLTGLPLLHTADEMALLDAAGLYRAPGWDSCPLALADVDTADAYGLLIKDL
ncbi:hypothetical protein [Streptomyces californicus]|uniref:hypothetical protein n=1 Tax=Streptomyces californicus TaxID=67351 RepID=UPI0004C09C65|nr:hypothetical protein [Streptomyces californicus]QRV53460.1 hypothetical protein I6J40_04065 [Streptomyces californicus]